MKVLVDKKLFERIEHLARLSLKEEEREKLRKDLNDILNYMKILDEIPVEKVEPMFTPVEFDNDPRDDAVKKFENYMDLVKAFPDKEDKLLKVPGIHVRKAEDTKK